MQAHSTAITIDVNDVKFSGFTINMPTDGIMSLGGINASGDRIEIVGNKLGSECSVQLNGELANFSGNSVLAGMNIIGNNQTIRNNLLGGGLDAQGSFGRITGNVIGHVNLRNTSFNLILNNTFPRMYMESCDSNFIANNTLANLVVGFYGHGCFNNTVCNNKVTGPGSWGILMRKGSYNVFHDNLISNFTEGPSGYGVAIGGNEDIAENNTFYRNIFTNNECHVGANWEIEGAGNVWDNGREGNYWDNYRGKDVNGDGIGDVPYDVEGRKWDDQEGGIVSYIFGQDNFPLMAPFNIDDVKMEFPDWASSHSEVPPEPFPWLSVVAVSGAVAVVVAVAALVYLKKRKPIDANVVKNP
jgi:parallel beta-helix repeat protein